MQYLKVIYKQALNLIDIFERRVVNELKNTWYRNVTNIYNLVDNVKDILSVWNQTGEGWFLTTEMVEFRKNVINNIVCIQLFAWLPNHIVWESVIKIREEYKESNIFVIDYDPGSSHTNQINRIKLMLTVAYENLEANGKQNIEKWRKIWYNISH